MKAQKIQFVTYVKTLVREPASLIWTILWPILLCTFYVIAFSGLWDDQLTTLPLAIHEDNPSIFIYEEIEPFELSMVADDETGDRSLYQEDDPVIGYIDKDNVLHFRPGDEQSSELGIVQNILDSITGTTSLLKDAYREGVKPWESAKLIHFVQDINSEYELQAANPMAITYFSLFGMTTLMATFSAQSFVAILQADQTALGVRQAVSPTKKSRFLFYALLISFLFVMASIVLLYFFMQFVVGIDLLPQSGHNFYILSLAVLGNLALGLFIGVLPLSLEAKNAVCLTVTLMFPTLAGMMTPEITFLQHEHAPILLQLNPTYHLASEMLRVNLLDLPSEALQHTVFFLLYTLIFFALAVIRLRRQRFKSLAHSRAR